MIGDTDGRVKGISRPISSHNSVKKKRHFASPYLCEACGYNDALKDQGTTKMERREFLALLATPAYAELARRVSLRAALENPKADVTIHISPVEFEAAPRTRPKLQNWFIGTVCSSLPRWMVLRKKGRRWCHRVGSDGIRSYRALQALAGITATVTLAAI